MAVAGARHWCMCHPTSTSPAISPPRVQQASFAPSLLVQFVLRKPGRLLVYVTHPTASLRADHPPRNRTAQSSLRPLVAVSLCIYVAQLPPPGVTPLRPWLLRPPLPLPGSMKRERDEEEDWDLGNDSRAQVPRLEGAPATAAPEVCALSLPVFPCPFLCCLCTPSCKAKLHFTATTISPSCAFLEQPRLPLLLRLQPRWLTLLQSHLSRMLRGHISPSLSTRL